MLDFLQDSLKPYSDQSWEKVFVRVANQAKRVEYEDPLFQERFGNNIGKPCYKFWQREIPCRDCVSDRALVSKKPESREEVAKDGKVYLMTSIPIHLNGEWSTVEIIRDVTEAKVGLNILEIIASNPDIRQVYNLVSLELSKAIDFDRMSITVLDEASKGTMEVFVLATSYEQVELKEGTHFPIKGSILERLMDTRSPMIVDDTRFPIVKTDQVLLKEGVRSRLSFPLECKGQIIGSLNFGSRRPAYFKESHLKLLGYIAPQLAIAVENSRLLRKIMDSEGRFRTLVDSFLHLFFTRAKEGKFTLMSPSVKAITGHEQQEFYENSSLLDSLIHPEDRERVRTELDMVWSGASPSSRNLEYRIFRKDGRTVWLSQDSHPIRDDSGEVVYLEGFCTDITEFKRMEEMKDNLLRDITHELRTPLAKMEMVLQLYEKVLTEGDGEGGKKRQQVYDTLLRNIYRLKHSVRNTLELSSLESGQVKLKKEEMGLKEVLIKGLREAETEAKQKGLKLVSLIPEEIPTVLGDGEKLWHAVVNLLDNSIKYTDKGTVTLSVKIFVRYVEVTIADTGRGMEKELLDRIFERFVQESPAFAGLGIGLPLCKKIIEGHGGRIWAESEGKNKGTSFHFTIPVVFGKEKERHG